jgi:adenylate cyclase
MDFMAKLRRAFRNPAAVSLLLSIGVFALVGTAREVGLLQSAEFLAYDKLLVWRAGPEITDPRIVIVEITENDIAKYDFPIPDNLLAKLLEHIERARPIAIGLDIYRDVAVPRDGSHLAELNHVCEQNKNIIGIFKFGDPEHPIKVAFPPVLADTPERYGFNDFPFELGAVRRAFLFLWDTHDHVYPSFALALALQSGVAAKQERSEVHIGKAIFPRFHSSDGSYVRAQDGGQQFLLDFKSPRRFATYSLDDVLSNRVNEEAWRNKIVLIGEGAESAHDFDTTPLQANVPGVELNAQLVNQLLRAAERGDKPTTSWREPGELAWIFVWCILGGAIGFLIRRPLALLGACIAVAAVLSICCWMAFDHDFWLPFVPALGGNFIAAATVIGYARYQERKDRESLMRLFSQNVSPAIANSIWSNRDEFMEGHRPHPQKLTVTVLFTDFRNFAAISEKLQPVDAMELVNEYLEALAGQVERHDGVIDKYMGDAIMAVFGFPLALTDKADIPRDACNAVNCALDMGAELRRLNETSQQRGRAPVQVRIGIFSGPAVAGCIGSSDRLEFTMIGDTVNVAERLESFDKEYAAKDECRILIGQSTLELLDGKFTTEFVQNIKLKGKNETTTIYRVLGRTI